MKHPAAPFFVPTTIDADLARVRDYWDGLKRAEADIPFSDDFNGLSLPGLADRLMLVDVMDKPMRFRINSLGQEPADRYGKVITGKFIDDLELKNPLEYLLSQCCATVESRAPTFHRHVGGKGGKSQGSASYSRLLLPMWGEGHIGMLLGAFVFH